MSEQKIAIIKTGWSDDFMGSPVVADHKHAKEAKDGHEKYNFLPGPDGRYYAYTPPIGESYAVPNPKDPEGWLIFSVAKRPGQKGLYLTGWYEDATFVSAYTDRPEYDEPNSSFPIDNEGVRFSYTLTSDAAVRIDPDEEPIVMDGLPIKRSPIYYLRGNNPSQQKREDLAKRLLAIREQVAGGSLKRNKVSLKAGKGGICADPERRKEVEEAAIAQVYAYFPASGYEIIDCQKDNCGFDLLVRNRRSPREELHIEVKGTQNLDPHFLMSRNEYSYMMANPKRWRLAMVSDALGARPKLEILKRQQALANFFLEPFTWHGKSKG